MLEFLRTGIDDRDYQVVVEREEDGTFVATSPVLPGYVAYGSSESSAVKKLHKAIRRNLEGFAEDWVRASSGQDDRTSRHKSSLHFRLPLTRTAKLVLSSVALAAAAGLVRWGYRLRRD